MTLLICTAVKLAASASHLSQHLPPYPLLSMSRASQTSVSMGAMSLLLWKRNILIETILPDVDVDGSAVVMGTIDAKFVPPSICVSDFNVVSTDLSSGGVAIPGFDNLLTGAINTVLPDSYCL